MSFKVIIPIAVGTAMLLSGCHEKNEGVVAEHVISLDVDELLDEEVSIFDMFSAVEVTSLDNTYDMDGSLVLYSYKKGRGPGEYLMADQINYNDELDVIEVLNPTGKILRYTPDSLKFISGVDFFDSDVRAIHNFYQCGEDYILYSFSGSSS